WRPLLLGLTLLLLGLAWYRACRKPKITLCSEPDSCAAKPVSQWNRFVLSVMTALVLGVAGFPALLAKVIGHLPSRMAPSGRLVSLKASLRLAIPSMDCAACAQLIQATLRREPGIETATVTFQTKAAVLQYDPTRISRE